MTTAKTASAAKTPSASVAHPSLRDLDRPVKLAAANAPGWGSDVVAETLRVPVGQGITGTNVSSAKMGYKPHAVK